jgi:hypothetical protein
MKNKEEQIRDVLDGSPLTIDIAREESLIFDNIDTFVALSRDNNGVEAVELYPFDSDVGNYEFWDKVGQTVGNFMELQMIDIFLRRSEYGDEAPSPDWEILARILRHLRRKVEICLAMEDYDVEAEEIQGFARAIHGNPMISEFSSETVFPFANLGPWCSALAALPL